MLLSTIIFTVVFLNHKHRNKKQLSKNFICLKMSKQLPIHDYALWSVEQAGAMSFNLGHCMDARERNTDLARVIVDVQQTHRFQLAQRAPKSPRCLPKNFGAAVPKIVSQFQHSFRTYQDEMSTNLCTKFKIASILLKH